MFLFLADIIYNVDNWADPSDRVPQLVPVSDFFGHKKCVYVCGHKMWVFLLLDIKKVGPFACGHTIEMRNIEKIFVNLCDTNQRNVPDIVNYGIWIVK